MARQRRGRRRCEGKRQTTAPSANALPVCHRDVRERIAYNQRWFPKRMNIWKYPPMMTIHIVQSGADYVIDERTFADEAGLIIL
jgi:hypothetical protein